MSSGGRYTVLGLGEKYVSPAPRKTTHPREPEARNIDAARELLEPQARELIKSARSLPAAHRVSEVVVEIQMGPKFLAKSYSPGTLLDESGLRIRGVGAWEPEVEASIASEAPEPIRSRAVYVSGSMEALGRLHTAVARGINAKTDAEIRRVDGLRLFHPEPPLAPGEQEGSTGAIEIVLLDWDEALREEAIEKLTNLLTDMGVPEDEILVRRYSGGPTFVATSGQARVLRSLLKCNYLRTARPLPRVHLADSVLRHAFKGAMSPLFAMKPTAKVAIFDGGYKRGNALLDPYVTDVDLTTKAPQPKLVEHGTMVASAAVFGPLDGGNMLLAPLCTATVYRVLPDPKNDIPQREIERHGASSKVHATNGWTAA